MTYTFAAMIRRFCFISRKIYAFLFFYSPRVRKRCLIFIIIIIIIIACIAFAYHYGFLSKSKEEDELKPPNPVKALPASASVLRRFQKAAVCADGAACAEIGK